MDVGKSAGLFSPSRHEASRMGCAVWAVLQEVNLRCHCNFCFVLDRVLLGSMCNVFAGLAFYFRVQK